MVIMGVSDVKADAVMNELRSRYDVDPESSRGPKLRSDSNEWASKDRGWYIFWEEGPTGWADEFETNVPGVYCQSVRSWGLVGIYKD
jgi:hypothetical protein